MSQKKGWISGAVILGALILIGGFLFWPESEHVWSIGQEEEATFDEDEEIVGDVPDLLPEDRAAALTPPPIFVEITPQDCADECEYFVSKPEQLAYCRSSCGLSGTETTTGPKECGSMVGVEKDMCFKDRAVDEHDLSLCERIIDQGLKKTCQNRVTEDLL